MQMHPLFYRQTIPVTSQAFTLGSGPLVFDLPRESVIDQINIWIDGTVGTTAATAQVEGLPALIQSISLRGSLANAPEYAPINGLTGPDMYEAAQVHRGKLPYLIGSTASAAKFRLNIPIYCRDFFFSNEQLNLLTAIPAYLMSTLKLVIQPATQAQMDTNGTATFAITGATCGIEVKQFYRDSVPDNIQFIRPSWESLTDDSITTAPQRELKFPAGGHYSFMLARAFSGSNTKQADTGSAPFTVPGQGVRIYDLSRFTKAETGFQQLRSENYSLIGEDSLVTGNAAFLWNRTGEAGLFQTGAIGVAQNNILIQYDATAASNAKVRWIYRRLLDPSNLLGISLVK